MLIFLQLPSTFVFRTVPYYGREPDIPQDYTGTNLNV